MKAIPVIAISGEHHTSSKVIEMGDDNFFEKPVDFDELERKAGELIRAAA
jgi:hypothetical protein